DIPREIATEVAHAAADYVAAEAVILDFLKTGSKDSRQFSEARQEAMRRIGVLGKQVRHNKTRRP
ncbi:MAG: hypothetical protein ACRD96_05650, partial [Bryobacteraceae bacterium]